MTMYLTLDLLKRSIGITGNDNDEEILGRVMDANQQIDAILKPIAEAVPLPPGDPSIPLARYAALEYAKHLWNEYIHQLDKARYHLETYQVKAQMLADSVRANRPDRTKTVFVTTDPRDDTLLLPSEKETFVLG